MVSQDKQKVILHLSCFYDKQQNMYLLITWTVADEVGAVCAVWIAFSQCHSLLSSIHHTFLWAVAVVHYYYYKGLKMTLRFIDTTATVKNTEQDHVWYH